MLLVITTCSPVNPVTLPEYSQVKLEEGVALPSALSCHSRLSPVCPRVHVILTTCTRKTVTDVLFAYAQSLYTLILPMFITSRSHEKDDF